ncbi:MAG TPA: hypothetical protein VGW12_20275 [Pyrinomonadaceae bacterium]|nr:hypothetical protein [Pyrinomonadaceae bacterium]
MRARFRFHWKKALIGDSELLLTQNLSLKNISMRGESFQQLARNVPEGAERRKDGESLGNARGLEKDAETGMNQFDRFVQD